MFLTNIYFILIGLVLFILPQLVVAFVYKKFSPDFSILKNKEFFLNKNTLLVVLAFFLPVAFNFLPVEILKVRWVNFMQHALGGGAAVTLTSIYMMNHLRAIRELSPIFNFFKNTVFQAIFIFMVVSSFGALNEIFEFTLDALKIGVFSASRYDTWYDIVANTAGAIVVFALYRTYVLISKVIKHYV